MIGKWVEADTTHVEFREEYKYFEAEADTLDLVKRKEICKMLELPEKFAVDIEEQQESQQSQASQRTSS